LFTLKADIFNIHRNVDHTVVRIAADRIVAGHMVTAGTVAGIVNAVDKLVAADTVAVEIAAAGCTVTAVLAVENKGLIVEQLKQHEAE